MVALTAIVVLGACKKDEPNTPVQAGPVNTVDTCGNVQARLDAGERPWQIAESGVSYDCLYGKLYYGGIIYFVDTVLDFARLVTRPDEEFSGPWACIGVMGANGWNAGQAGFNWNAIVANCDGTLYAQSVIAACRSINHGHGDSLAWLLPTRGDLFQMHDNLALRGLGGFDPGAYYWSSSEHYAGVTSAWVVNVVNNGNGAAPKEELWRCRCNLVVQN